MQAWSRGSRLQAFLNPAVGSRWPRVWLWAMPTQQTLCEKTVSGSTRSGYVRIAVAPTDETRALGVAIPVVGEGGP